MKRVEMEELVLELLANGPSSFAALYGFVARNDTLSRPSIREMIDVLNALESSGWVRVMQMTPEGNYKTAHFRDRVIAQQRYEKWLQAERADLSVDALSFDQVGIWIELLPAGRAEREKTVSKKPAGPTWTLDFNSSDDAVVVRAPDVEAARHALTEWLMLHGEFEALEERTVLKTVPPFRLRNGTLVAGGVEVRSQLVKKRK